jgi:hypothetical protein
LELALVAMVVPAAMAASQAWVDQVRFPAAMETRAAAAEVAMAVAAGT